MFQPVPVFVGLRHSLAREHSFFVSFITWVSLSGVALGVAILIVVLSVMNGLGSELRDRLLSVSAHASLNAAGAAIPDWRLRIQQLHGAPGLVGAAPYLDTDAMLSRQPAMSGAVVRGIDPGLEAQVSTIADSMREGKLSDLTPGGNRIILGRMLAYQLEVGVGDTITVMTPGNGGAAVRRAAIGGAADGRVAIGGANRAGSCPSCAISTFRGFSKWDSRSTTAPWRSSIWRTPRPFAGSRARRESGSSSTTCSRRRCSHEAP